MKSKRRGSMAPAIVPLLLVVFAAVALVVDRAWVDAARVELERTTDASALAAAHALVTDDLLRSNTTIADRVAAARLAAEQFAERNLVAGRSLNLLPEEVVFGKYVFNEDESADVFVQTEFDPWAVAVAGRFERSRNNPIPLIMSGFAGPAAADVAQLSIARIENRLVALRAGATQSIPAFPVAVFDVDPAGDRVDAWQNQIVQRMGADLWGIDSQTRLPTLGADGVPEIILILANSSSTNGAASNACLIDFGAVYSADHVTTMIEKGITSADLANLNSQIDLLNLPSGLGSSTDVSFAQATALTNLIGQQRILFLYHSISTGSTSTVGQVALTGVIAGRVMSVASLGGQGTQLIVQPTVLSTPTAETIHQAFDPATAAISTVIGNSYIYNVVIEH